jgi:hypothetical protein
VHLWMGKADHVANADVLILLIDPVGQFLSNWLQNAYVRITKYLSGNWDNFPPPVYHAKVSRLGNLKKNELIMWPVADISLVQSPMLRFGSPLEELGSLLVRLGSSSVRLGSASVLKDGEDSEATESLHEDEKLQLRGPHVRTIGKFPTRMWQAQRLQE